MFLFLEYISAEFCVLVQLSVSSQVRVLNFGLQLLPLRVYKAFVSNRLLLRSVSGWLFPGMYDDWFSSVPIQACLRMTHDWFEGSDLVRVSDVHELAFVLGVRRRGLPYLLADQYWLAKENLSRYKAIFYRIRDNAHNL